MDLQKNLQKHRRKKFNLPFAGKTIIRQEEQTMSDIQNYIEKRIDQDPEFTENFEEGYKDFRMGVILRQARESAGLTQEEVANKLRTKKSAISRIENHADDVRISTIRRFAVAGGAHLQISLGHAH